MLAQGYSCATGLAWVTLCLNDSWHSIADRLLMSKPETGLGRDMACMWGERGEVTSSQMINIPLFPLMMHAMSLPYYSDRKYKDVCYIILCHVLHIHSGKTGILFSSLLCSLWWVQIVGYDVACRSYSFVFTLHHLIIIIVPNHL